MKLIDNLFSIASCESSDSSIACEITLDSTHFIYAAHFPGNPITPGVCIVQIAQEILEQHIGSSLTLKVLNNIKFMQVLSPTDTTSVQYRIDISRPEENTIKIKAAVSNAGVIYSKFTATYSQS